MRKDSGCCIDLCLDENQFAQIDTKTISVFNPYNVTFEDNKAMYYTRSTNIIIKKQIEVYIKNMVNNFKKNVLNVYRRLLVTIQSKNNIMDASEFDYIDSVYEAKCIELYLANKFEIMKNKIMLILIKEISRILNFYNKESIMSTIKVIIETEKDPYKMSEMINKYISL